MYASSFIRLLKTSALALLTLTLGMSQSFAQDKVTVFAAASLTNALTEIGQQYDKSHPTQVLFSFASSSTLARQIEEGAPADIYLSANQKWMDYLVDHQAVDAKTRVTLLKNQLVLIAPKSSPIKQVQLNSKWDIKTAVGDSRLAVGNPAHVPAGRYAKQALENLGLWQQAQPLLASANNVRAALALVERGEAPLGIVYATDAQIAKDVKVVATFPANSHKPIEYPLAIVAQQPNAATQAFYQYLQTPAAKAVFAQYGFGVN